MILTMNSLTKSFEVRSYETDFSKKLKPASFMNYAQYMAEEHAGRLSFGYDNLIENQNVWVLSRIHVVFKEYPIWRDNISLKTWHKGTERLFGVRDFRLKGESGEDMILATSSWLIIDINTRKIQRVDKILSNEDEGVLRESALEESAGKIEIPSDCKILYSRVVAYSDIDVNRHTNNARYVEWATDALFSISGDSCEIREMTVNFNSECRLGEKIDICAHKNEKNVVIEGRREGTNIFTVLFKTL